MSSSQETEDSMSNKSEDQLVLGEEQVARIAQHGAIYIIGTGDIELYQAGLDMEKYTSGHPIYDAYWVGLRADTTDEIMGCIEEATERMKKEPKSRFIWHMPPIVEDWPRERGKLSQLHEFMEGWIKKNMDLPNLQYCTVITPWQPNGDEWGMNREIDPETENFKELVRTVGICCFKTSQVMRVSVPHWNKSGRLHLIFLWLLERYTPGWETNTGDEDSKSKITTEIEIKPGNPSRNEDVERYIDGLKGYIEGLGKEILGGLRHNSKMISYDTRISLEVWNRLTKFGDDVACCMICSSKEHNSNSCDRYDYIMDPFVCRKCLYAHTGMKCVEKVDRKKKLHKSMPMELMRFTAKRPKLTAKPTNARREETRGDGRQPSIQKQVVPADYQQKGQPMDVDFDNDPRPPAEPSQLSQQVANKWKTRESRRQEASGREKETREVEKPRNRYMVLR